MAFFRKWKTHYKHKKFIGSDAADGEDWGLESEIKDSLQESTLDVECIEADDEDTVGTTLFATYAIKYLGCTPIETKRSEKVTSEAIKTVIANSKAGGRRNKTQKRVMLNVSPDGIEVLDQQTQENLIKLSIYKVSYCSVDAAYDHTFSFVGSQADPLTNRDKLSCHVFQCPKRKIAHEITLMVARCFENAYQHWRDSVVEHSKVQGRNLSESSVYTNEMPHDQNTIESKADIRQHEIHHQHNDKLLINLDGAVKDIQKSWVSFEEEARDGVPIVVY